VPDGIVEIAPSVFTFDQSIVEGKNGIVMGSRRALAIDAGNAPAEGAAMADFIRARGFRPDLLLLTHGHGDHILGGGAFRDGDVVASDQTPAVMRRHLPALAGRYGYSLEGLSASLAWPNWVFTGELELDLGGRIVRLFATPGHSQDGVSAYLPAERILFAADTVVTGIVPAIADGQSRQLERSLRRIQALPVEILVAGHGPPLLGAAAVADGLEWTLSYVRGVRRAVGRALKRGIPPGEIAEAVTFERHVGGRLPPDRHGMVKRHRDTVVKITREVVAENSL
jgi:glyoxylase-like metal-dependent hydrolase (beta-lactamase superfamily II)